MKRNKLLEKLVLDFLNFKPILPGTVTKQYKICGKPNCRCVDKDNPQKHPSFQFSYTLENKKSTVYVKKLEVEVARKMTESYKNLRKIITAISLEAVKTTRKHGAEKASEIMQLAFDKARSKAVSGKIESGKLRDAKISRNSWKNRALRRKRELDKHKITIRDLADSRKKWRNQTLKLRTKKTAFEKTISEQKNIINKLELKQSNNSKKN